MDQTPAECAAWQRLTVRERAELARHVIAHVDAAVQPYAGAVVTEQLVAQVEDAAYEAVQSVHRQHRALPPVDVSAGRSPQGALLVGLSQWLLDAAAPGKR